MSEFDRNFQIKVQGTWCKYQDGLSVDLSKIKKVVSYRGEMGWPFKFYFTDGDYIYVQRAEIGKQIEQALKDLSSRQAEIDELKGRASYLESAKDGYRDQAQELQKEIEKLKAENTRLSGLLKEQKRCFDECSQMTSDLINERDQLKAEKVGLEKRVQAVEHVLDCAIIDPKEVFQYAGKIGKALRGEH